MKCARNKSTNNNVNGTLDGIKESLTSANNEKGTLLKGSKKSVVRSCSSSSSDLKQTRMYDYSSL